MTTQEALIKILESHDLKNCVKDVVKTKVEIVKLLIDAQKLENENKKLINDSISTELEYSKIMRQYEVDNLYEDGEEVDHND
jgi:hypothetical protein